jgi:hypothetical protein
MLVGASQLSLSTMNVAVEVLHSLDKPGLTLEVRIRPWGIVA